MPYRPYMLSYQTYHTQQTYIPYLPSIQYHHSCHTYYTYHTYHTYHTFQTCQTRQTIHTIHTQHTIPHPPPHHRGEGDSITPLPHHRGAKGKISIWDPSHGGGGGGGRAWCIYIYIENLFPKWIPNHISPRSPQYYLYISPLKFGKRRRLAPWHALPASRRRDRSHTSGRVNFRSDYDLTVKNGGKLGFCHQNKSRNWIMVIYGWRLFWNPNANGDLTGLSQQNGDVS